MNRRSFLGRAAAAGGALFVSGCRFSFEQGLFNDCRPPTVHSAFRDPLVRAAWDGVRPELVWDTHAHLFGNGRSASGIWVSPAFDRPDNIAGRVRYAMFRNGGCVGDDEARMDAEMVRRLAHLAGELPEGAKVMLLAFDFTYDGEGRRREESTTFAVSDAYAAAIARSRPERFEWIASVHPYRTDAISALEAARNMGARAVKWLPSAMGIDLASPRCVPFYDALRRLGLPLLTHVGEEQAVEGARREDFGNPLHLRHALDRGVRVIAAHCASLGASADLDAVADPARAPKVANIDLFARLMRDPKYARLLYGDISSITQSNRAESVKAVLLESDWHPRLLNGTDYPLPGIMPLFSLGYFVREGMLAESALPALRDLRHINPLMFDFVLKRSLAWQGRRLPASVFETRPFFESAREA